MSDILTTYSPSFVLVEADSQAGLEWLTDNVPDFDGRSLPIEHRYFADIAIGAIGDGLILKDTTTGRVSK